MSILYDGQNGRQYKSVGRLLIDKGAIAIHNEIPLFGNERYIRLNGVMLVEKDIGRGREYTA